MCYTADELSINTAEICCITDVYCRDIVDVTLLGVDTKWGVNTTAIHQINELFHE